MAHFKKLVIQVNKRKLCHTTQKSWCTICRQDFVILFLLLISVSKDSSDFSFGTAEPKPRHLCLNLPFFGDSRRGGGILQVIPAPSSDSQAITVTSWIISSRLPVYPAPGAPTTVRQHSFLVARWLSSNCVRDTSGVPCCCSSSLSWNMVEDTEIGEDVWCSRR